MGLGNIAIQYRSRQMMVDDKVVGKSRSSAYECQLIGQRKLFYIVSREDVGGAVFAKGHVQAGQ